MRFYLNNQEVKVETKPTITQTQDFTLDSAFVILKVNNVQNPIAPMQNFIVEFDNGERIRFLTANDVVEVFSLHPITYKHNLTLIEPTRLLSHQIVKNSVFSQPANNLHSSFYAGTLIKAYYGTQDYLEPMFEDYVGGHVSALLEPKEKVKSAYIEIDVKLGTHNREVLQNETILEPKTLAEIETMGDFLSAERNVIEFHYKFPDEATWGVYTLDDIDFVGGLRFNEPMRCPRVEQLLKDGVEEFYIEVPSKKLVNAELKWEQQQGQSPVMVSSDYLNFQVKVVAETYYYNCYDILDLLRKRQQQIVNGVAKKQPLFNLPVSGDLYDLLKKTVAPNFTFTQCSMYECVAEVFRLYDAIFTLDENNVLGIEYFNQLQKTPKTLDFSAVNLSISEDRFNDGFITYYQDARVEEVAPSKNGWMNPRAEILGVPNNEADLYALLPHPISKIKKVEIIVPRVSIPLNHVGASPEFKDYENYPLDITDWVFDESIWTLLDTGDGFNKAMGSPIKQVNSIYYTRGDNKIQLFYTYQNRYNLTFRAIKNVIDSAICSSAGLTQIVWIEPQGYLPNVYTDLKIRVIYETSIDGKIQVETTESKLINSSMMVNQSSGAVDLNKLGLNILGTAIQTGEPTLNATQTISSWADRIKKGDIYEDALGQRWVANNVSYTFLGNSNIIARISFVKNFNAISNRIRLIDEKRMTNISNELITKSEDNLIDYVYFSRTIFTETTSGYIESATIIRNILATFDSSETYKTSHFGYAALETSRSGITFDGIYIPWVKYGAGNCLCFEMSFTHPISAGNQTKGEQQGWWSVLGKYYTKTINYTDDEQGFKDKITIDFAKHDAESVSFPEITNGTLIARIPDFEIYKQPNEIFALNYEMCFLTKDKDLFVGQGFITDNFFVNDNYTLKRFYLRYSNDEPYSTLDFKGFGSSVAISSVTGNVMSPQGSITFNFPSTTFRYWAICDEDENVYFSGNQLSQETRTSITLYFITSKNRL